MVKLNEIDTKAVVHYSVYNVKKGDKVAFKNKHGNIKFGKSLGYNEDHFLIKVGKKKYWIYKTKVEKVK